MRGNIGQALTVKGGILRLLAALAVISAIAQVPIDPSIENLTCVCWVLVSTFTMLIYIGMTHTTESQPLSTLSLLGFCITTQLGALLAQSAAWTPLRSSLYVPVATFSMLAICQGIAVLVHAGYCHFFFETPIDKRLVRGALKWAGLYELPPSRALWIMGYIGLISWMLGQDKGVIGRVADGFRFLTWAPFLIGNYHKQAGESYCNAHLHRILIIIFSLLIVALGVALNFRQIMFFGIVTIALLHLSSGLRNESAVKSTQMIKLAVAIAAALALAGPVSDLATAMVVARTHRGKISELEMISTTIDVMKHPYLIAAYRAREKSEQSFSRYAESYIANPLLTRLVETKFHDNSLYFSRLLTPAQVEALSAYTIQSGSVILPEPLFRLLNINVPKTELQFSLGDFLAHLTRGMRLGGFKTGSALVQIYVLFGLLSPFIYALFCLMTYAVFDLLSVRESLASAHLSALAMMRVWLFFIYGITAESLGAIGYTVLRDIPQMIAIYCALLWLCKNMVPGCKSRTEISGAYDAYRSA